MSEPRARSARRRRRALACLLLAAAACGAERDGAPTGELERAAALALVDQVSALHELSRAPADRGRLLEAVRFAPAARLLAAGPVAAADWHAPDDDALPAACVTTTATTATFSACEIDGHWVDGTLSRAGTRVNAEIIDVFILDAGRQGASSIDGELALTGDSIDGALAVDASWAPGRREITLHATITFAGVLLDPRGCPIAGSMSLDGSLSAPPRLAALTAHFGPACGDVQIVR